MNSRQNPNISYFARVNFRDDRRVFGIHQKDRAFHSYILGKTGAGKSNLLLTKILQDVKHKRGICVFDVHGDLIQTVLQHIPSYQRKDLIYLDSTNPHLKFGYNPLRNVSYEKRSLVAGAILDAFEKLWKGAWGMKMEHILRFVLLTLLDQPKANLRDILRILQDEAYRNVCITHIINPDVRAFWEKEFIGYSKADLMPIYNKVGAFLAHPIIRRLLVENADSISFRRIMDEQKMLLVNLSKGAIGADVAHILGALLLSSLASASFSRIDLLEAKRLPFYLYLDEFQNYTGKTLVEMLSELRKFKVSLTLAHQYLHQLEADIRYGVLGNVGTIICFRVGAVDAQYMVKELFKEYQPILSIGDYVNLPNHHIYLKLMIDGKPSRPFSATTLWYKEIL